MTFVWLKDVYINTASIICMFSIGSTYFHKQEIKLFAAEFHLWSRFDS